MDEEVLLWFISALLGAICIMIAMKAHELQNRFIEFMGIFVALLICTMPF